MHSRTEKPSSCGQLIALFDIVYSFLFLFLRDLFAAGKKIPQ